MSIPRLHHPHFISSSYVHLLSEVVARWNISAEELFWGTGVEIEKLHDINYKISLTSFKKVIARTIDLTQEQGIGFYASTQLKISSHGLLGFTVAIAKNPLDAIQTINQFVSLQCSFVELNFSIEQEHAYYHIIYDSTAINMKDQTDLQVYEFSCVCFLIGFVRLVRFFIPNFKPSIDLQCKFPKYFSRFDEILSTTFKEIRYEQPRTGLITSPQFLGLPLCMSDPLNYEKFKLLCQKELDKLSVTQDILYHVKHLIDDPNEGLLNIDQVAQKLNLTKRTLQRMLQEQNVSFQILYDQVRKAKAQKLLLNPFITKDEIAKNLGYSSLSSFNRAYKRWENQ
ncbi:helix-turn-helix transcriptional regulator [Acinetobacter haemolyticus]|uniref:AraC family transcriptional regulator n=1 Tax=Acinetobacter haemolyticus TaxID=29430 RepID=A0A857IPU7_ACIHA|nr:AraC family transcriptional regulator [Acinetobacter haemolyticus]QHI11741.1 AraC family transcriptional regulator [Acinetobacter haemolyticus]QHI15006.1 AraC family transcriptional regulator [Acinetobacter haemolyticus]